MKAPSLGVLERDWQGAVQYHLMHVSLESFVLVGADLFSSFLNGIGSCSQICLCLSMNQHFSACSLYWKPKQLQTQDRLV